MSDSAYSFDRPRFYAIAISGATGNVYELPGVSQWSWQKRDDGSSGSFTMRVPMQQSYDVIMLLGDGAGDPIAYASVAGPMDIIALYANRTAVGSVEIVPQPLKPNVNANALNWGDQGAKTIKSLGTPNCIFIGMVDRVSESGSPGQEVDLAISGRDLTKIFEVNDVGVPDSGPASNVGGIFPTASESGPSAFNLENIELVAQKSGSRLLVRLLDILCAKDLSGLLTGTAPAPGASSYKTYQAAKNPAIVEALKSLGFPWRNFIRTDGLDPDYEHINSNAIPPFNPNAGPVWPTIMEIRNAPLSRLFVNELGQIIFDDSLAAWTSTDTNGALVTSKTQYAKVAGNIGVEDIRDYDFTLSDADLLTFFSVLPNNATTGVIDLNKAKGVYLPGSGYAGGLMAGKTTGNPDGSIVKLFGYRYQQFESIFDVGFNDVQKRRRVVQVAVNSLYSATVTLRGRPEFRVGKRYMLDISTSRYETTEKVWYVESISQQGAWGEDWTTTLELRYPQEPVARPQATK